MIMNYLKKATDGETKGSYHTKPPCLLALHLGRQIVLVHFFSKNLNNNKQNQFLCAYKNDPPQRPIVLTKTAGQERGSCRSLLFKVFLFPASSKTLPPMIFKLFHISAVSASGLSTVFQRRRDKVYNADNSLDSSESLVTTKQFPFVAVRMTTTCFH